MSNYGHRDGGSIVHRLTVTPTTTTVLRAMLDSVPCVCGQRARRLTVECAPVTPPKYGSAQDRTERKGPIPLRVLAWCGDSDRHEDDWEEGATNDPQDVAMSEEDL